MDNDSKNLGKLYQNMQPELIMVTSYSIKHPNIHYDIDKIDTIDYDIYKKCLKHGFVARSKYGANLTTLGKPSIGCSHSWFQAGPDAEDDKGANILGCATIIFKKNLNDIYLDDEADIKADWPTTLSDEEILKIESYAVNTPLSQLKINFSDPEFNEHGFYGSVVYNIRPNEIINSKIILEESWKYDHMFHDWAESIIQKYQKLG